MFDVAADNYGRFMGRYSEPLAGVLADQVDLQSGQRVLDVGCGPGALTAQLVARVGAATVSAVDPSAPFIEAAQKRFPDVDIQRASAEELPFAEDTFDASFAALVVHFMADPVAGLREMGRVTRPGGAVAACVWDYAGGGSPLSTFWAAVTDLDPGARTESELAGARQGHLVQLCQEAGLNDVVEGYLTVRVPIASFEEWWDPYTLGVGPAGVYVQKLDDAGRTTLRHRCRELLPEAPFEVSASAWSATAIA
jgi:SAM-dependent methyltransferase